MSTVNAPVEGSCRCGQVRIRIGAPPLLTMACHCTGCQKMSASAFSLSAAFPSAAFAVIQGEPVIGGLHGATRHYFCPNCLSWMFTRPEGIDFLVNVRAIMLENAHDFVPFIETFTSEKLPWAKTPAVHSFTAFPAFDDYEGLTKAYAQATAAST